MPASGLRAVAALLGALLVLAVAGCGSGSDGDGEAGGGGSGGGESTGARPGPAAEVTITLWPEGQDGEPVEASLTCDPAGGTHPDPEAACALLMVTSDPAVLAPVPPDAACTMIFGGPEQATVAGVVNGKEVDAAFERSNGCELERWDRHAALFQIGD